MDWVTDVWNVEFADAATFYGVKSQIDFSHFLGYNKIKEMCIRLYFEHIL